MALDFHQLAQRLNSHIYWRPYLDAALGSDSGVGFHLAVFSEPFLQCVLNGDKTVEMRFSTVRCAPYGEVFAGDVILAKKVAGPVCGLALAKEVSTVDLQRTSLSAVRAACGGRECAPETFWSKQDGARYVTLIELEHHVGFDAIPVVKKDRRGWVSLRAKQMSLELQ